MRRKRMGTKMQRVLVCVMAALLVVGLVPVMPEVPFALADEPEAVLELGDEILDDLEDAKPEEGLEGDEETISVDADIMVLDKHAEDESDIEVEM